MRVGFGALPGAVPIRAADPPALAGETVAGADDEDGEFRGVGGVCAAVDFLEEAAEGAHAGAAERVAERGEGFSVGERGARGGGSVEQRFDMIRIE